METEKKKRVMLVVAYDGTNYCGWQVQNNGITIEEVLNKTLTKILGENIEVMGTSRTDSGVHALGNVAVFDTTSSIPGEKMSYVLNQYLPEDIRITKSQEVDGEFHPRFNKSSKTYEYKIVNARFPRPTLRLYSHFLYKPLDVKKMRDAAKYLVGEHDFASFCSAGSQVTSTVRTLYGIEIIEKELKADTASVMVGEWKPEIPDEKAFTEKEITIKVWGEGFLYNMVRIIAGTLIEIGEGCYPPEEMKKILDAKDRSRAGRTAPAKGLTLIEIKF